MRFVRINALAVYFGVLPKHPELASIQKFLERDLQLDIATLECVQIHSTRGIAYVGLPENLPAAAIAERHHLQHEMLHDGKPYSIPVLLANDDAVDVRVHDLPPEIPNDAIAAELRQYGEVLAVTEELWKLYFPGVKSGVRVARMVISRPIPRHIAIHGTNFVAHVRHPGQAKKVPKAAAARKISKPVTPPAPASAAAATPTAAPATSKEAKKIVSSRSYSSAAAQQSEPARMQDNARDPKKRNETEQPNTTPGEEDFTVVSRHRNKNRRQHSSESTEPADKFFAAQQLSDSELDEEILKHMTFEEVRQNHRNSTWKWCKIHHNIKA